MRVAFARPRRLGFTKPVAENDRVILGKVTLADDLHFSADSFGGEPAYPTSREASGAVIHVGHIGEIFEVGATVADLEAQAKAVQASWGWGIKAKLASKSKRLFALLEEHDAAVKAGEPTDAIDAEIQDILAGAGVPESDLAVLDAIADQRDELIVSGITSLGQINPAHLAQATTDAERRALIEHGSTRGRTWAPTDPTRDTWMARRLHRLSTQKPWLWGKYAGAFSGAVVGAYADAAPGVLP